MTKENTNVEKSSINKNNILVFVLDILVIFFVLYALGEYCYDSIENIVTKVTGFFDENSFSKFTTLSNLFALVVCLICIPYHIIALRKKNEYIFPKWLYCMRLIATTLVIITFLVVNLVLVWIVESPYALYEGKELFTHVINPILVTLSFLLDKHHFSLNKTILIYANIPVVLYSILYFIFVFIVGTWGDFYAFGFWYPYSIVLFAIALIILTTAVTWLLYKISIQRVVHNKN